LTPNPRERDFWWDVGRATFGILAKTAFRLRVAGAGNVPAIGGAEFLPAQKGAAGIALMAGAPVVPVGLWGTQRRWPKSGLTFSPPARPTVAVVYGEPIRSEGDPRRRPDVQALTNRIMDDISGLVAQARRSSEPSPHSSPPGGAQ